MNRVVAGGMICSKKVSRYDRQSKLALPVTLMGSVWPMGVVQYQPVRTEFRVVDLNGGQQWIFECHLRWDASGYPKPEVYGQGWRDFILAKGLNVGDNLIFYEPPAAPLPGPPPVLVISVMRPTQFTFNGVQLFDPL